MKIIGVTGGIGAGKSTVLEIAKEHFPVAVIYTDLVAREQMKKGGCSYSAVVDEFGTDILQEDGEINRNKLAEIIFADEKKVKKINSITHPNVKAFTLQEIERCRQSGKYTAVLVETALLFEAKFDEFCDETWCIYASEEVRRKRLMASRHYSNDKINAIFEKQESELYAQQHCTYVIMNDDNIGPQEIVKKLEMLI